MQAGERNRGLSIIKSRGTSHSNQVRELQAPLPAEFAFLLYVAGDAANSTQTLADGVFMTPTLIKLALRACSALRFIITRS